MANSKKVKATRAQPTNKKSKSASKNPENKTSSMADAGVASPATSPTPSGFFTLPPELRNNIYRYVLVSDEPIKIQFDTDRRKHLCHFTMLPALATVCKQVRLESQRIFFEENQFEVTPKLWKDRTLEPLAIFRQIHRLCEVELRTLRVCRQIKKRCNGHLFLCTGHFTVTNTGTELIINDEAYSAVYMGRSARVQATAHHMQVCGCRIRKIAREHSKKFGGDNMVQYLKCLYHAGNNSRHVTDMSRPNEVVDQGLSCQHCAQQGVRSIEF